MQLAQLLAILPQVRLIGDGDVEVRDIAYDSRRVVPGSLFVAIAGLVDDGHRYADAAVAQGAMAVVGERELELPPSVPQVVVPDSRRALAYLSAQFFGHPSKKLRVIGVTGTNGKTTTTYMIRSILQQAQRHVGLIGTVQNLVGDVPLPVVRTTPESTDLQRLFGQMQEMGGTDVVMEVSSHAIALERVLTTEFDVVVLTNVTQDHLDYHKTLEQYRDTKKRLFSGMGDTYLPPPKGEPKWAVVNRDDPSADLFLEALAVPAMTYSTRSRADVYATDIRVEADGTRFLLHTPRGDVPVHLPMPGGFNVQNALAAACVGVGAEISPEAIRQGLEGLAGVPGRFERVDDGHPFTVIVDYAHTPDGLWNILVTAREFARGRVMLLFGAGGDRDRSKRPQMGAVAARGADRIYITADNPRTEDLSRILEDIVEGVKQVGGAQYQVIPDRESAIRQAVADLEPGDVLLIAGKGHETYQIFRDRTISFDDRKVARAALADRGRS